jgi:two-component system, NtrC family, nitrogen regulation sensor histidine kinase GlnL
MTDERPQDLSLYMRVLENMEEAVIAVNDLECVVLFNPAAQVCCGFSERQALGRKLSDLFSEQSELLSMTRTVLETGRSFTSHEDVLLPRYLGDPLPVGLSVAPLYSLQGRLEGAVLILRDQSQVRQLEETVRQADRLAMLGTLAAGLAHEIKNPLGGIKGAAQLLDLELPPESPLREYTTVMTREVNRVNDLIEELLDLARPHPLRPGAVNLSRVLSDLVLLQEQSYPSKSIDFQMQLDPSIPPIRGDENLLVRLFLNLLKNAAEAIDEAGTVTITSRVSGQYRINRSSDQRPVPLVTIEIRDTGRGIEPDALDRIFTPFFSTKVKGCGLGLAICQKIVNDHEGFLKVESTSGQGTVCTVALPMHRSPSQAGA